MSPDRACCRWGKRPLLGGRGLARTLRHRVSLAPPLSRILPSAARLARPRAHGRPQRVTLIYALNPWTWFILMQYHHIQNRDLTYIYPHITSMEEGRLKCRFYTFLLLEHSSYTRTIVYENFNLTNVSFFTIYSLVTPTFMVRFLWYDFQLSFSLVIPIMQHFFRWCMLTGVTKTLTSTSFIPWIYLHNFNEGKCIFFSQGCGECMGLHDDYRLFFRITLSEVS